MEKFELIIIQSQKKCFHIKCQCKKRIKSIDDIAAKYFYVLC